MISERLTIFTLLFFFYSTTIFTCNAQGQNEQRSTTEIIQEKYNQWLEQATLDTLFYIKKVEKVEDRYFVTLYGKPADPKILSNAWKLIEDSLRKVDVKPADILLYQFSQAASRPISECTVIVESSNMNVFGGDITYKNGEFRSTIEYITQRGSDFDLGIIISSILSNPNGQLPPCTDSLTGCRAKVRNALIQFLKTKKVPSKRVAEDLKTDTNINYEVSDIKKVITEKYHENITFIFFFYQINDLIIAKYEVAGLYASGFNTPGEFRDMKKNYYKELASFRQEFVDYYSSN